MCLPIGADDLAIVGYLRVTPYRFAPRFRLDDENSSGAEHDMIKVEVRPDDVVKNARSRFTDLFKILSDCPLAIATELKIP